MEGLRQYVSSVICVSLISGIVLSLVQEQGAKGMLKLLCGAVLALTVVSPLPGLDLDKRMSELLPNALETQAYTAQGENLAREAWAELIKQEAEAYILDKATSLHGDVQIEIEVGGDMPPVPVSAELVGVISPEGKRQLESILQKDLGIPKENVRWNG